MELDGTFEDSFSNEEKTEIKLVRKKPRNEKVRPALEEKKQKNERTKRDSFEKAKVEKVDSTSFNTTSYRLIEQNLLSQSQRKDKFLMYISHDGFSNQILSLRMAAWFSWILRRTLVLPPVFSHQEALVRGNCYNKTVGKIDNQRDLIKGKQKRKKKKKKKERKDLCNYIK